MRGLDEIIEGRRSIRKFLKEAVAKETIENIIRAASWAPSACNLQHWEFIVIRDNKIKQAIYEAGSQKHILNAPVAIAVLYDRRFTPEQHANVQSVAAATQNMLLKAFDLGLGSLWMCAIGDANKVKNILRIPDEFGIASIVLIGYPAEEPSYPPFRRPLNLILHENAYSGKPLPSVLDAGEWSNEQILEFQQKFIRAKAGFSWRSLDIYKKRIIEYILAEHIVGRCLCVYAAPGSHLWHLSKKHTNIFFCEKSHELVNFISEEVNDGKVKGVCARDKLPFKSESFDTVLIFEKFEQLLSNERILFDIRSILKADGKLIVVAGNKLSFFGAYVLLHKDDTNSLHRYFGPITLQYPWSIEKKLKDAGFKTHFACGVGLFPGSNMLIAGLLKYFCKYLVFECSKTNP